MTRLTDSLKEPGLALVTALLVVVLVGALILGVFTTSVADYRISRNLLFQEQALAAAEYGQNDVLRSWDTSWVHTMQPGNVTVRPVTVLGGGLDSVRVTRLDNTTFWLVSTATVGSGVQTIWQSSQSAACPHACSIVAGFEKMRGLVTSRKKASTLAHGRPTGPEPLSC